MKRFWDHAAAVAGARGYAILLDDRPLRLPGGGPLVIEGEPLAAAIAEEWQRAGGARDGEMSFEDTPLTRLAGTAAARVAADPDASIAALAAYGATDLLCYRAEAPPDLVAAQQEAWDPWLDWAATALDARLVSTAGVMPVVQPPAALAALRRALAGQPPAGLTALGLAVPALGSLVLGLALVARRLTPAQAHALATLDERFQEQRWGTDADARAGRRRGEADIALAARFLELAS